jgi:predicted metal-dependent RNase
LGEALIFVKKPWPLSSADQNAFSARLAQETGWKVEIKKVPRSTSTIEEINRILRDSTDNRVRFFKEVGEKIFRVKLDEIVEASLITLGGFAEVGRSSILLSTHESKILLDCGLVVSRGESARNVPRLDITGIEPNELDAIVLSHAHFDHSGFLPSLFKFGFRGPVYCSEPTLPLMYLLQKEYVKNLGYSSLYSEQDIQQEIVHTIPLSFGIVTDIAPDVKLLLSNAGHILGSSLIHLHIGTGDYNLLYTGDLKFGKSYTLENATWNFPRVETLIIESTYGGKGDIFPQREQSAKFLVDSINDTVSQGGKVLLPVASVGLAQELMLTIDTYMKAGKIDKTKILIEKIILETTSVHEIYPDYLSRDLAHRVIDSEHSPFGEEFEIVESAKLDDEPLIILSPPSALIGGPSIWYLRQIAEDRRNKLIFTSYQPADTPGRCVEDGGKEISVCGESILINCQVHKLEGFSNHSDYNQLVAYVSRLASRLRRILVNHGERVNVQNLATSLNRMFKIPTQHPIVQEAIKLI